MRSPQMRTTLAIDDDVMQAARVLARQQGSSLGAVISALAAAARSAPGGTGGSGACEHLAR
jgi:hypothetical protein